MRSYLDQLESSDPKGDLPERDLSDPKDELPEKDPSNPVDVLEWIIERLAPGAHGEIAVLRDDLRGGGKSEGDLRDCDANLHASATVFRIPGGRGFDFLR